MSARQITPAPVWLRLALSVFSIVLVGYYLAHGGWRNFFWLSDVSLFITVAALWGESPLLNSMLAVGVLPFELYWNLTFLLRLSTGIEIGEIPDYMFDDRLSLVMRGISLFHIVLPIIWIRLLLSWGYDTRAFRLQTLALWSILVATYCFTSPAENINWVFMPHHLGLGWLPENAWLIAYMLLVPVVIYWPLDQLYSRYLPRAN